MKNKEINMQSPTVRMKNSTDGITLVALVITIIVLLILAGIAVVSLTGDNGIIKKGQEAKDKTEQGAKSEQEALNNVLETMNQLQGGNTPSVELPETNETSPYFPDDSFSTVSGTDLDTGLVVTDGTNEYVWVEVSKSVTASASTPEQIGSALQNYASAYRQSGWTDAWYNGCGIASQAEYDALKNKMLNSIKTYGGFWIGRYEAGTADNSKRTTETTTITSDIVSAQDRYVYNCVTLSQAQELCNRKSTSNYTSSLLFGIQWDLTCKYLESKGIAQATIKTDSTAIGNYGNASFTITRGAYSKDNGLSYTNVSGSYTKTANSIIILTTGARERNMNIYDLAGNQWEWTLEKAISSTNPCANRGGDCNSYGYESSLASRYNCNTSYSHYYISFRQTLYK